jgi:hypothetical protein
VQAFFGAVWAMSGAFSARSLGGVNRRQTSRGTGSSGSTCPSASRRCSCCSPPTTRHARRVAWSSTGSARCCSPRARSRSSSPHSARSRGSSCRSRIARCWRSSWSSSAARRSRSCRSTWCGTGSVAVALALGRRARRPRCRPRSPSCRSSVQGVMGRSPHRRGLGARAALARVARRLGHHQPHHHTHRLPRAGPARLVRLRDRARRARVGRGQHRRGREPSGRFGSRWRASASAWASPPPRLSALGADERGGRSTRRGPRRSSSSRAPSVAPLGVGALGALFSAIVGGALSEETVASLLDPHGREGAVSDPQIVLGPRIGSDAALPRCSARSAC